MTYSEKSKVPWGAIVVVAAVIIFGCIIAGALTIPRLLQNTVVSAPTNQPVAVDQATATPAPPEGSVVIDISSANTKEDWMNAVVEQFNQEQHKLSTGEV